MIKLPIKDILNAVNGRLIYGDENALINGISTDSRTVKEGELFFALQGPRFDGHKYVDDAFKKGAVGAVVSSPITGRQPAACAILVNDTLTALGNLARYWRELHPVPLVAVSGTCGKTTTKEMIASILRISRPVIKTEGNLNNLIGLPLTIFGLNNIHRAAVVELGISQKGEMKRLSEICKPDVAVLTNIGEAHTATLGDIEGVAFAKGDLFRNINENSFALINIDDPWLSKIGEGVNSKKVTFSIRSKADVMLKDLCTGGISATFAAMGKEIPVRLKYAGMHNLSNAAAAIAATLQLGAAVEEITDGLYSAEPAHGRMEIISISGGIKVIDDTYNANPLSMAASLKTMAGMKGRKIAVLGDMLELGDISKGAHENIGRLVKNSGIDMLFVIGNFSKDTIRGAVDAGMSSTEICEARDKDDIISVLNDTATEGDIILIKGSRGMKMEEVVKKLQDTSCKM